MIPIILLHNFEQSEAGRIVDLRKGEAWAAPSAAGVGPGPISLSHSLLLSSVLSPPAFPSPAFGAGGSGSSSVGRFHVDCSVGAW